MDCGHFKKTNDWLAQRYGVEEVVNWDLNEMKPIAKTGPVKVAESAEEVARKNKNASNFDGKVDSTVTVTASQSSATFSDDDEDDDAIEAMNGIIAAESGAASSLNGTQEESVKQAEGEETIESSSFGKDTETNETFNEATSGGEIKEETVISGFVAGEKHPTEKGPSAV